MLIGFVWVLIDGFLIPGMVRKKQEELRQRLMLDALSHAQPATSYAQPAALSQEASMPALAIPQAAMPVQLPRSSDTSGRT